MIRQIGRFALLTILVVSLGACSWGDDDLAESAPPDQLYSAGEGHMQRGNYQEAIAAFEALDRQHPYSQEAAKAQTRVVYAHYKVQQFDEAIIAADRFLQLHPAHEDAAYVRYLKAMSYYQQIADVKRDQALTNKAQLALRELMQFHPNSKYTREAIMKMDLTQDHLAGKEMEIGRYYQRRGNYLAAVNRFQQVVARYQTTTHVPEALHRLTECYLALGMHEEARRSAAVLGHNYPGSEWYQDSFALVSGERVGTTPQKDPWYKFW